MSYQVLARKWRPSNFSEVAGQTHVLKSLVNALDNGRLHHAYLFTGTRGVGKTTLARILARCLNCEEGIGSTPCGVCEACVEIGEGRFIDLIEVDAASRTKVEDTRELLENVQYTPARGRFKVYLIDEVHMLSNHSFNALLKTLEEPPPHVKFLFATTDPQKLPITILSRCLQFNLKNLSPGLITEHLSQVLKSENIGFEEEALWQIAASASGSMRDALTLCDQAIAFCEGSIKADGVVDMLGVPAQGQVLELLETMAAGDASQLLKQVQQLSEQSPDYSHSLDALLDVLHRVAIAQISAEAVDNSFGDREAVLKLAEHLAADDVQLFFQIGSKGREELRFASDIRATFEMLLIRMMLFSPRLALSQPVVGVADSPADEKKKIRLADPDSSVAAESAPLEGGPSTDKQKGTQKSQTPAADSLQEAPPRQPPFSPGVPDFAAQEPSEPAGSALGAAANALQSNAESGSRAEEESQGTRQAPDAKQAPEGNNALAIAATTSDHDEWLRVFPGLGLSGIVANVMANCVLDSMDGDSLNFILDQEQSAVYSEELLPKLVLALSGWRGASVELSLRVGVVDRETPAQRAVRLRQEAQQALEEDFLADQRVVELVDRFSATVDRASISANESS